MTNSIKDGTVKFKTGVSHKDQDLTELNNSNHTILLLLNILKLSKLLLKTPLQLKRYKKVHNQMLMLDINHISTPKNQFIGTKYPQPNYPMQKMYQWPFGVNGHSNTQILQILMKWLITICLLPTFLRLIYKELISEIDFYQFGLDHQPLEKFNISCLLIIDLLIDRMSDKIIPLEIMKILMELGHFSISDTLDL